MEEFTCPRCGNKDQRLIGLRNGKPYCRACLSFSGREATKSRETSNHIRLSLDYPLSARQSECAKKTLSLLMEGKNVLIHAVTGAGKTELVYDSMLHFLKEGGHVGFATPRRDVVIDLLPRIRSAFPTAECVAVYGDHTARLDGDIVVLTAHQLYRYPDYFDLLVFDEIDAFPYKGDDRLKSFFRRSVHGRYVLLSATPSLEDIREIKKEGGEIVRLFERYHGGKLPVPRIVLSHSLLWKAKCALLLRKQLKMSKPAFVFSPTIAEGEKLFEFLHPFFPNGAFVSSKSPNRKKDIALFKDGRKDYLVTTSILERGVTVKNLQVIVYNSASSIYDQKALVQIAGRAGRKIDAKEGEVLFLADEVTPAMKGAIDEIQYYNRRAFVPFLS